MDISIELLTDLVAIRLGEFPDWRTGAGIGRDVTLDMMTRRAATSEARRLTAALPPASCTDLRDFRKYLHDNTDWGFESLFPCTLPDDFMRIHSLWMPDWSVPLTEEHPADPLRLALGDSAPDWLTRHSLRPMIRIAEIGDGKRELWFGPTSATMPRAATYIAAPAYNQDADMLTGIQPAIIPDLTAAIASIIAVS